MFYSYRTIYINLIGVMTISASTIDRFNAVFARYGLAARDTHWVNDFVSQERPSLNERVTANGGPFTALDEATFTAEMTPLVSRLQVMFSNETTAFTPEQVQSFFRELIVVL